MKRAVAIAVTVLALLGTALAGTASATTAVVKAPPVTCNDWKVWPPWGSSCWCPPGWKVKWPPLYEFWQPLACVRDKS